MMLTLTFLSNNLRVWLIGFGLTCASQLFANQCLDMLPYDTVADGLPKICHSNFNGVNRAYSCQDYKSGKTRYRVLYRGGLTPKAVLQFDNDNSKLLLSAPIFGDARLRCPLKPPVNVPKHATHRGVGICVDDQDQQVACSVFEHAAARVNQASRFMVFYAPDSETKSPVTVDAQVAGTNSNAMVAELAYQIGMSLWDTECCSEQAVEYLAHAYYLFPQSQAYRAAYQRSRVIIAMQQLDQLTVD